jgi:hypothetical protein
MESTQATEVLALTISVAIVAFTKFCRFLVSLRFEFL